MSLWCNYTGIIEDMLADTWCHCVYYQKIDKYIEIWCDNDVTVSEYSNMYVLMDDVTITLPHQNAREESISGEKWIYAWWLYDVTNYEITIWV